MYEPFDKLINFIISSHRKTLVVERHERNDENVWNREVVHSSKHCFTASGNSTLYKLTQNSQSWTTHITFLLYFKTILTCHVILLTEPIITDWFDYVPEWSVINFIKILLFLCLQKWNKSKMKPDWSLVSSVSKEM